MICLKLNRFFYGLSRMLHLSEFVWTLRSSVLVVFNNFLLIDATDRSKISSDQKGMKGTVVKRACNLKTNLKTNSFLVRFLGRFFWFVLANISLSFEIW